MLFIKQITTESLKTLDYYLMLKKKQRSISECFIDNLLIVIGVDINCLTCVFNQYIFFVPKYVLFSYILLDFFNVQLTFNHCPMIYMAFPAINLVLLMNLLCN